MFHSASLVGMLGLGFDRRNNVDALRNWVNMIMEADVAPRKASIMRQGLFGSVGSSAQAEVGQSYAPTHEP